MRVLAIETVGATGSVAALNDEHLVAERQLDARSRSARSLVPGIADLLDEVAWRPGDVELVAVATGPGSFTGLRIGVTTAKVFAYSTGCQAVGVHTLLAIASRAPREIQRLKVVLDAQRGELFVADFQRLADGRLTDHLATRIAGCEDWLAGLVAGDVVTGPGLVKIAERLPSGVTIVDSALRSPTAGAVGRIGLELFRAGLGLSAWELLPKYFRATAAEEQWNRKRK